MAEGIMSEERLLHHNIDKIKEHYGIFENKLNKDSVDSSFEKMEVKHISEGDEDKFEDIFEIRNFAKRRVTPESLNISEQLFGDVETRELS